jgi:hypothetical protein
VENTVEVSSNDVVSGFVKNRFEFIHNHCPFCADIRTIQARDPSVTVIKLDSANVISMMLQLMLQRRVDYDCSAEACFPMEGPVRVISTEFILKPFVLSGGHLCDEPDVAGIEVYVVQQSVQVPLYILTAYM